MLMLVWFVAAAGAAILSSANITQCFDAANCTSKLFVSLTVQNGQTDGSETLGFAIQNYTDAAGNTFRLSAPVNVTVAKTPVKVVYPLTLRQTFPCQAYEAPVATNWPYCSEGVVAPDGSLVQNSTCGFQADPSGQPVQFSGGFCCTCPTSALISGVQSSSTRNTCTQNGNSQWANCLRFSDCRYKAYLVGSPKLSYNISVTVSYLQPDSGELRTNTAVLSPSVLQSREGSVYASVVGSFLPASQPPAIESDYLLVPSEADPVAKTPALLPWLILAPSQVTFDGSECNKVGVSYRAYQNQNNGCNVPAKSCLANQISDLVAADTAARGSNLTLLYSALRFGNFSKAGNSLELPFPDPFSTLLSLQIDASQMTISNNLGSFWLVSCQIADFFVGGAPGKLDLVVQNNGTSNATFELNVACSEGISPVGARLVGLRPAEVSYQSVQVLPASDSPGQHSCNVTIKNNYGVVTDARAISFLTSLPPATDHGNQTTPSPPEPVPDNPSQNNGTSNGTSNQTAEPPIEDPPTDGGTNITLDVCASVCPSAGNSYCLIGHGCGSQLALTAYYATAIGVPYLLLVVIGVVLLPWFCKRRSLRKEKVSLTKPDH